MRCAYCRLPPNTINKMIGGLEAIQLIAARAHSHNLVERGQIILGQARQQLAPQNPHLVRGGECVEHIVLLYLPPENRSTHTNCDLQTISSLAYRLPVVLYLLNYTELRPVGVHQPRLRPQLSG